MQSLTPRTPSPEGEGEYVWDYEILIHDDCSTDGTTEIVKEYAAKYPEKIFPMYEDINQYQNGKAGEIDFFNYRRARGKYIAYCEGDDYWTDPLKLQKQVEFMEAHEDFSVCFTRWKNYYVKECKYTDDSCEKLFLGGESYVELTRNKYFEKWYTQPLTMLFRVSCFDAHWRENYTIYRDIYEIYHLLKEGKCAVLNFVSGQYNHHAGGIFGIADKKKACETELTMARELYAYHKDESTKNYLRDILQWNIYSYKEIGADKYRLSLELFSNDKDIKRFIKNLLR